MVSWEFVRIRYERSVRPPLETISVAWHEILIDAIASRQQETAIKSQRRFCLATFLCNHAGLR